MRIPVDEAMSRLSPDRDVALDVIRSWSLIVVVFGHFLMWMVHWKPGNIAATSNTLASGTLWPYATWLLQVMPLFFIAGGAVNYQSWARHSGSWSEWTYHRFRRLMRPTLVFLAIMMAVFAALTQLVPQEFTDPLSGGITGPLWFLAAYVPIMALTPWTSRLHRKNPVLSVVVLAGLVAGVDVLRFAVNDWFGVLNLLLAWTLVHQLGYMYANGVRRRTAWLFLAGGITANTILTTWQHYYPRSLVGIPTDRFSNVGPPTMVLMFHAFFLFGLFCLLAPWLRRVFSTGKMLRATVAAGILAMSVYLYHMFVLSALVTGAHFVGLDLPTRLLETDSDAGQVTLVVPDGIQYWLSVAPFGMMFGVCVYLVARLMWPVEFLRLPVLDRRPRFRGPAWGTGIGLALTAVGLLGVAGAGLSGFPNAVHYQFGIPLNVAWFLAFAFTGTLITSVCARNARPEGGADPDS